MRAAGVCLACVVLLGCGGGGDPGGGDRDAAAGGPDAHIPDLANHEGQFWGWPHGWCTSVFLADIESSVGVVVGTDITVNGETYPGAHDCTLGRDVRYHLDWGDGTTTWTDFARCDGWLGVPHTFDEPGVYPVSVFAEDRDGLRTRARTEDYEVLAEGIDLVLWAHDVDVVQADGGATITFTEELMSYGNVAAGPVEIRYVAAGCDGEEVLETRTIELDPMEEVVATRTVEIPSLEGVASFRVVLDPNDEVTEICPKWDRVNNVDELWVFDFCGPISD